MPIQLKVAHMKIRPNRTSTERAGPGDLSAGTSYAFANTRSIIADTTESIPYIILQQVLTQYRDIVNMMMRDRLVYHRN